MQINENQIEEIKNDSTDLIKQVNSVEVATKEDYSDATQNMVELKKALKFIESERTEMTKPLNEVLRNINNRFKAISEPMIESGKDLKIKMVAFIIEEQRKADIEAENRRKEQEKIDRIEAEKIAKAEAKKQELLAKAQAETDEKKKIELDKRIEAQEAKQAEAQGVMANNEVEPVEDPNKITRTDSGSSSVRKIRKARVIDFAKLPDKYKTENMVLIRHDALKGEDIAGVEVYEDIDIATRT